MWNGAKDDGSIRGGDQSIGKGVGHCSKYHLLFIFSGIIVVDCGGGESRVCVSKNWTNRRS